MKTPTADLTEIAALLCADGHAATVEHPGCICVVVDEENDMTLDVGTVNGPWEIDLNDNNGAIQQSSPGSQLPVSATAREVADWVGLAVENYREVARDCVTDEERSNGRGHEATP